ncbi:MAG TPA: ABC transporter permease [candidate division WOR-3 bacterium]|uniref:ABC transporter permease n=1 Tax=candidate division WOR-3 bacterium TaxID=2052148 RepID=A0A7V0Q7L9_UNCW3|nr:ABC transporter permease [candidate division WOR-3 bacterium]
MDWSILRSGLRNISFKLGGIIFLSVVLTAIFAPIIAPYSYDEMHISDRLKPPSSKYLLGTDQYGRDIFSRIVYGSRIALKVGILVVIIETAIGISLGLLAGYYGGKADKVISFTTDVFWAMPPLVLALAVVTLLGPGLMNVMIAIAVVSWAQFTRVVRAKSQSLKKMPFVEAGKAIGESDISIMLRYILPNTMGAIIVLSTLALPSAILSTTAMGFLGLGAQPPAPDWGVMLSEGISYIKTAPWISIFPGLAIVYTVLGFNLLGEGLRDILDPRLKV